MKSTRWCRWCGGCLRGARKSGGLPRPPLFSPRHHSGRTSGCISGRTSGRISGDRRQIFPRIDTLCVSVAEPDLHAVSHRLHIDDRNMRLDPRIVTRMREAAACRARAALPQRRVVDPLRVSAMPCEGQSSTRRVNRDVFRAFIVAPFRFASRRCGRPCVLPDRHRPRRRARRAMTLRRPVLLATRQLPCVDC